MSRYKGSIKLVILDIAGTVCDGPHKGAIVTKEELDLMLDEFYESHCWDKNGIPTPERIKELGLEG